MPGPLYDLPRPLLGLRFSAAEIVGKRSPAAAITNREEDFSFVLLENGNPRLACSLTFNVDKRGHRRLGYMGMEAATHFSRKALESNSNNLSPSSAATMVAYMEQLLKDLKPDVIEFQDSLNCGVMSPVTEFLIANGGLPKVSVAKQLDLAKSSRSLLRYASKPVRSGIQWGQRKLKFSVGNDSLALASYCNRYDELNDSAGSGFPETIWQSKQCIEYMMEEGAGFLINASYLGQIVGTVLFSCRKQSAHYLGVQVSDYEFGAEVACSLIWQGLMHAKSCGCKAATLDHHFNLQSEKLVEFAGFGGDSISCLKVLWQKNSNSR